MRRPQQAATPRAGNLSSSTSSWKTSRVTGASRLPDRAELRTPADSWAFTKYLLILNSSTLCDHPTAHLRFLYVKHTFSKRAAGGRSPPRMSAVAKGWSLLTRAHFLEKLRATPRVWRETPGG